MPDDFNKNTSIEDEIEKSLQKMVEEETTVAKAYVGNADDYKAEQPSDINDGKTRVVPKITDEILKEQQVINKSSQPTQEELTDRDILLDDDDDEEPEDEDKEILKDATKKPLDKKTKLIIAGVAILKNYFQNIQFQRAKITQNTEINIILFHLICRNS